MPTSPGGQFFLWHQPFKRFKVSYYAKFTSIQVRTEHIYRMNKRIRFLLCCGSLKLYIFEVYAITTSTSSEGKSNTSLSEEHADTSSSGELLAESTFLLGATYPPCSDTPFTYAREGDCNYTVLTRHRHRIWKHLYTVPTRNMETGPVFCAFNMAPYGKTGGV